MQTFQDFLPAKKINCLTLSQRRMTLKNGTYLMMHILTNTLNKNPLSKVITRLKVQFKNCNISHNRSFPLILLFVYLYICVHFIAYKLKIIFLVSHKTALKYVPVLFTSFITQLLQSLYRNAFLFFSNDRTSSNKIILCAAKCKR